LHSSTKKSKESIYIGGSLFSAYYILLPIIVAGALNITYNTTIEIFTTIYKILIITVLLISYIIAVFIIFSIINKVYDEREKDKESFINKTTINNKFKYIKPCAYTIIITSFNIIGIGYSLKSLLPFYHLYVFLLFIITTSIMTIISALHGYNKNPFDNVTITIKDSSEPKNGIVLRHEEYLLLYNKETKKEIKYNNNEIVSIEYND